MKPIRKEYTLEFLDEQGVADFEAALKRGKWKSHILAPVKHFTHGWGVGCTRRVYVRIVKKKVKR